jgi:hypothetical protein
MRGTGVVQAAIRCSRLAQFEATPHAKCFGLCRVDDRQGNARMGHFLRHEWPSYTLKCAGESS